MENFLKTNLEEVHIKWLTDKMATQKGIEKAISNLANDGRIKKFGDPILTYFAGHGA